MVVEQVLPDGYVVAEAPLPALVTVSNEVGLPRYPTMRNIMAAKRKRPTMWKGTDLGLDPALLAPQQEIVELFFPSRTQQCEFITADDAAAAGRQLAITLREACSFELSQDDPEVRYNGAEPEVLVMRSATGTLKPPTAEALAAGHVWPGRQ